MHPRAKATSPTGTPGPGPRARAKATSPTGTPGPGHSNGFLWAFKAAFCQPANPPKLSKRSKPSKTRQTLQTPSPDHRRLDLVLFQTLQTFTLKQLPQQAPQGQGHSNDFLWAFKAAVCQPAKAPIPSKIPNPQGQGHSNETFYGLSKLPFASPQRLQTFQNKIPNPQGQGHSNETFYGLSKLPFASPQTLQNSPNAPNAPNPPKPAKPSKHRPQQAPQIHSNDFLEAFKAAVCQPAKAATPPKFQTPSLKQGKATSPTGTPGPGPRPLPQQAPQGQATAMAFYGLSKLPFASPQTLQNSPNAPNPPKPAKPSKHRPQQAPQIHSNDFLEGTKNMRLQWQS